MGVEPNAKLFDWKETARQTLTVYQEAVGIH